VRCHANERLKLEGLCRYITRPALANYRVKINAKGQVELKLKLKTAWRDGTTHHVMSPLEFMQRLAALVPRPRLHLIRFHGVLVPNAKWRSKVVPQAQDNAKALDATVTDSQEPPEHGQPMRLGWAKLLKRLFNLDLTRCPHCGGQVSIVAAILQRQAIDKILNHLGLDP
jgi:hypothetical protein